MNTIDKYIYSQSDIIGKGSFSNVYIGKDMNTCNDVAIKKLTPLAIYIVFLANNH